MTEIVRRFDHYELSTRSLRMPSFNSICPTESLSSSSSDLGSSQIDDQDNLSLVDGSGRP